MEGSTRWSEEFRDDMPEALGLHDEILRSTIEPSDGLRVHHRRRRICRPVAAVDAAVAAQRALNTADWQRIGAPRVRLALNTGVADERNGDYFDHSPLLPTEPEEASRNTRRAAVCRAPG